MDVAVFFAIHMRRATCQRSSLYESRCYDFKVGIEMRGDELQNPSLLAPSVSDLASQDHRQPLLPSLTEPCC
jgi:hypothetical protein